MRLHHLALVVFFVLRSTAFAGNNVSTSLLVTPKSDASKLRLNLLQMYEDHLADERVSNEKGPDTRYFSFYIDYLDVAAKLKPTTVEAIRALPLTSTGVSSELQKGALTNEILSALGVDLEASVFVTTTWSAKIITIPVKTISSMSVDWGEDFANKKVASISFRFSASLLGCDRGCAKNSWAMAAIGKTNPFKDGKMSEILWQRGDLPSPIKSAAFQRLDEKLKEPGKANSSASIKTRSLEKGEVALVSAKASVGEKEVNLYLLRASDSSWYQLEESQKTNSDYFHHPDPVLIGEMFKDYDQVIVIGSKSGWDCGKVILIKAEKVTVQDLRCEPSSC